MKMYKFPFIKSMLTALAHFYRHYKQNGNEFFHFENYLRENKATKCRGAFNYLRYWGFIERPKPEDKTKIRGHYRITAEGIKFVKGEIDAPESLLLYDDKVHSFAEKRVFAKEIIMNFDYETMVFE